MKKFEVIRQDLYDKDEVLRFTNSLSSRTSNGFNIESCGISGDTARIGWAILSKTTESKSAGVKPQEINLVEAVKEIVRTCRKHANCEGCPLNHNNMCLAGSRRGGRTPMNWDILSEV